GRGRGDGADAPVPRGEPETPERAEADAVDADLAGVDLGPCQEMVERGTGRVLEIVRGQTDAAQVALGVPRPVEREHVQAALVRGVEERMRPRFLERVAARDVEDERTGRAT